ncbi:hypothetical protein ACFDTO_24865 [Microbacteriaceae bacterium 4G12]
MKKRLSVILLSVIIAMICTGILAGSKYAYVKYVWYLGKCKPPPPPESYKLGEDHIAEALSEKNCSKQILNVAGMNDNDVKINNSSEISTGNSPNGPGTINDGGQIQQKKKSANTLTSSPSSWLFLSIAIVFIIVAGWFFIRYRKDRPKKSEQTVSTTRLTPVHDIRNKPDTLSSLPNDDLRRIWIQWEAELPLTERRKPFETIQQWFARIQMPPDVIAIYEKVRYGYQSASTDDIQSTSNLLSEKKASYE